MAHPSCNSSAGAPSSPAVAEALPSVVSDVKSQNNRPARHHVQWSDPLVYTRGIPSRGPQGGNPMLATVASSATLNYSSQHDSRIIAGAMENLNLTSAVSTYWHVSSNCSRYQHTQRSKSTLYIFAPITSSSS
ncbi:hypothetical protein BDR07DRAFT_338015 [Suillus spraguei]|nr:hypothetical protein BDR07DRAFT_338015 [Suillus spraguei]